MNIQEIVEKYLIDNGYDGLYSEICGCEVGDLMPCGEPRDCKAGYKVPCPGPNDCDNTVGGAFRSAGCRWHIAKEKKS